MSPYSHDSIGYSRDESPVDFIGEVTILITPLSGSSLITSSFFTGRGNIAHQRPAPKKANPTSENPKGRDDLKPGIKITKDKKLREIAQEVAITRDFRKLQNHLKNRRNEK